MSIRDLSKPEVVDRYLARSDGVTRGEEEGKRRCRISDRRGDVLAGMSSGMS
jgi:hypothetical protein